MAKKSKPASITRNKEHQLIQMWAKTYLPALWIFILAGNCDAFIQPKLFRIKHGAPNFRASVFPVEDLVDKQCTQVSEFLRAHPTFDGRGTVMCILVS